MVTAMQIVLILVALAQAVGMMAVLIYNFRRIPVDAPDDDPLDSETADTALFRSDTPVDAEDNGTVDNGTVRRSLRTRDSRSSQLQRRTNRRNY